MTDRKDPLSDAYRYRPTRQGSGFVLRWFFALLGIFIVIGLTLYFTGFASRWLGTATQILSPENVKEQWRFAYDYKESLGAAAIQVCNAEKLVAEATAADKSQRQTQLLARQDNYARIAAQYNGRMQDAFRAKLVAPNDVPNKAPTLDQMKQEACSAP